VVSVKVGEIVGAKRVVAAGLHPGDRVVAEGIQKIKEGAPVNPLPFAPAGGGK
jgi:membrane fusion protein (multidrug efflux system)